MEGWLRGGFRGVFVGFVGWNRGTLGGFLRLDVVYDAGDVAWFGRAGDYRGHAGCCRQPRGDDLGGHATGAEGGSGARDVGVEVGDVLDDFDRFCVWVGTRVLVVEAVNVGHEKEVVCLDHASGYGGKGVVVAEFDFRDR